MAGGVKAEEGKGIQELYNLVDKSKTLDEFANMVRNIPLPKKFNLQDFFNRAKSLQSSNFPVNKPIENIQTLSRQLPQVKIAQAKGDNFQYTESQIPSSNSIPNFSNIGKEERLNFIKNRNVRIGQTSQLATDIENLIPDRTQREAIPFYREIKNNPTLAKNLQAELNNPTSPFARYFPQIKQALNPTPQIKQADQLLEQYFNQRGVEGLKLGYLKNNINDYINRIYEKGQSTEGMQTPIARSSVSRRTPRLI